MTTATALADDPIYPGDPYESVTLSDLNTSQPCGTVTAGPPLSGGCEGTISIDSYTFGEADCSGLDLTDVHFGTDGRFRVSGVLVSTCLGVLNMFPCKDSSGTPHQWSGTFFEHEGAIGILMELCLAVGEGNNQAAYDRNIVAVTEESPGVFTADFLWSEYNGITTADWTIEADISID